MYLFTPEGTTIGSCARTLLIPLSATIFALAIGSIISSVANLSKSAKTRIGKKDIDELEILQEKQHQK